tara:strand:- start:153 stop:1211 length:1059 start_codon:yes stop_codon:yes gene_type:complete
MNFFNSEYNEELKKQESLKRITSPNFAYTDLDVEVNVDNLIMSENDPRADGIDPRHVDALYYKISIDGVDDDSRAIVMETEYDSNKFYVIDQHHLVSALKKAHILTHKVHIVKYIGKGNKKDMWAAASDFGQKINNSHKITKPTTMASVVALACKKINTTGYIYKPNTPVDEVNIRLWFAENMITGLFAPKTLTIIKDRILNRDESTGQKVRSLTEHMIKIICNDTDGKYGSADLNNNRYGYIVKTDNFAADAPKVLHQILCLWNKHPNKKPVIITYSGKDNNETILSNYKGYVNKIYDTYRTHLSAIGQLHGCLFTALTFAQFLDKIEVVSIGQILGEWSDDSDFISRQFT